jgi:peptidoglycan hydrolase-like protein with peptidoglycan-binding domain
VGNIQPLLNLATSHQLTVNSQFGPKTQTAVKEVQKKSKISQDGVVGPKTWRALCNFKLSSKAQQDVYKMFAKQAGCKY